MVLSGSRSLPAVAISVALTRAGRYGGLDLPDLDNSDWCHRIAMAQRETRSLGLLVPSAGRTEIPRKRGLRGILILGSLVGNANPGSDY